MNTLKELQDRMHGDDKDDARAAAVDLANFYFVYNEEYNALQDKLIEAEAAYIDVTQNNTGVDQAEAMRLKAFELSLDARMALLDMKMRAFHQSTTAITPPTVQAVAAIKALSAKVAVLIAKDAALAQVTQALTEMGNIVNQSV